MSSFGQPPVGSDLAQAASHAQATEEPETGEGGRGQGDGLDDLDGAEAVEDETVGGELGKTNDGVPRPALKQFEGNGFEIVQS